MAEQKQDLDLAAQVQQTVFAVADRHSKRLRNVAGTDWYLWIPALSDLSALEFVKLWKSTHLPPQNGHDRYEAVLANIVADPNTPPDLAADELLNRAIRIVANQWSAFSRGRITDLNTFSASIASMLQLLSLPAAAQGCRTYDIHTLRDAAEHFALLAEQKIFPRPTFFASWLGPCVLAYVMPPGSFRKLSEAELYDATVRMWYKLMASGNEAHREEAINAIKQALETSVLGHKCNHADAIHCVNDAMGMPATLQHYGHDLMSHICDELDAIIAK